MTFAACHDKALLKRYMALIEQTIASLKHGGFFLYAPGTEVLEEMLSRDSLFIQKVPLSVGFYVAQVEKIT